ncbi:MAG: DUF4976 domain-containing protein, partial [Phycisphaerae bacterium]|nr:DUF4976 domain-containing protein [Phycisphaerae bacterium]
FWHNFQKGESTWSDRILKAIMEKQQAGEPKPYDPWRMAKDVYEFPQFPEDTANGHAAWTDWPWKLHRKNGEVYELYNLEDDPMETNNLISGGEHQQRCKQMKKELDEWMRSVIRSLNGKDYEL